MYALVPSSRSENRDNNVAAEYRSYVSRTQFACWVRQQQQQHNNNNNNNNNHMILTPHCEIGKREKKPCSPNHPEAA
jgi:hypothetical protein